MFSDEQIKETLQIYDEREAEINRILADMRANPDTKKHVLRTMERNYAYEMKQMNDRRKLLQKYRSK